MPKWTVADMPDQTGRIAVVTGANSGLGYETALALAKKGAHVVMACRNTKKGEEVRKKILAQSPKASLDLTALDLSSLESVREFAEAFTAKYEQLHLLVNNAGVMAPPYQKTADGFEMQFGTNHLGHFALTGLLLNTILNTPASRVVTVTSNGSYLGKINFDDLQSEKSYSRYDAYYQSKLANVMFAFELQHKLDAIRSKTLSLTAHPGLAETDLQSTTTQASGTLWERVMYPLMHTLASQSAAAGALPQLYAGTAPDVKGGEFYGPRWIHVRGYPHLIRANKLAYNREDSARLWQISEDLSGVHYEMLSGEAYQVA
jgi:protochlorophyllide reductase